jgi:hypothetical protein
MMPKQNFTLYAIRHKLTKTFIQAKTQPNQDRKGDLPRFWTHRKFARSWLATWCKGNGYWMYREGQKRAWTVDTNTARNIDDYEIISVYMRYDRTYKSRTNNRKHVRKRLLDAKGTAAAQEHVLGSAVRDERDVLAEQKE